MLFLFALLYPAHQSHESCVPLQYIFISNNVIVTSLLIYIVLYGLTQINPLGWQPGIQEGAADWDELEDKGNRNNTN